MTRAALHAIVDIVPEDRIDAVIEAVAIAALKPTAKLSPEAIMALWNEKHASRYTFEEFVVGNSNRLAHAAAQAVAAAPGRAYNPLFLYGGIGLGKTHLMHAIGHRMLVDNPNTNVLYVTCEKLTNDFIIAVHNNSTLDFRNRYRQLDALMIDDIQFLVGKEVVHEEFFHIFSELYESGCQLIISADRSPKQMLEPRLRLRFEWGLVAEMQSPDFKTREAILRKKAEHEKQPVPDEVITFIAKRITSNIREMEGALIRVCAYASLAKSPVTIDLAVEVFMGRRRRPPLHQHEGPSDR